MRNLKYLLFLTLLVLGIGLLITPEDGLPTEGLIGVSTEFERTASTNPDIPELLTNDSALEGAYGLNGYYYYKTGIATSQYYHVFWVYPKSDVYLAIYSDPAYTDLIVNNIWATLGWVVIRPDNTQILYPMVHSSSSTTCNIEWEISSRLLTSNSPVSSSLSASEYVESYSLSVSRHSTYTINLSVPGGANFDLYLYQLSAGEASAGHDPLLKSETLGAGVNESLVDWTPMNSGECVVIVVCKSGSGMFTLSLHEIVNWTPNEIPLYFPVILGAIFLVMVIRIRSRHETSPFIETTD